MLSFRYFFLIIFVFNCYQQNAIAQIVIKFSHIATADSPKGLAATHFKQVAEKLTSGKVRVDVYPNSELFQDNEEMEALQLNSVQMLAPSRSSLPWAYMILKFLMYLIYFEIRTICTGSHTALSAANC
jgi:TRAP-type C4-dicarboxylate transport system substrate-binding protein